MKKMMISLTLGLACAAAAYAAGAVDVIVLPPTTVVEPTVQVGSMTPTPESPSIARKEAGAVLAQARQECSKATGAKARANCLAAARDDYKSMMARAGMSSDGSQTR